MADSVAIVSVVTSGVVGVGGILSAAWGAWTGRKWQAREERLAELRNVLDAAALALAQALRALYEANKLLSLAGDLRATREQLDAAAREQLDNALGARAGLWAIVNRVQVRTGSASPIATALETVERRIESLHSFVDTLRKPSEASAGEEPDFDQLWMDAKVAENTFYDVAEAALWPAGIRSARRHRPGRYS